MKCSYHQEMDALDICPSCSRPICEQCAVSLSGKNYCKNCLEKRMGIPDSPSGAKSRFWAFVLSLIPGAGYFYLGLMKRGLQTMVIFFGTIFISAIAHMEALTAFVAPVLLFYSVFDTQQLLSRINRGEEVEDRDLLNWGGWQARRSLIGAGLIILGLFALLDNLLPYFFNPHLMRDFFPPLVIIGTGVYILYRNIPGKGGNRDGSSSQEN